MEKFELEKIGRTKEGLLVKVGDEDVIVRVILKKEKVEAKDIVEFITKDAEEVEEAGDEEETG